MEKIRTRLILDHLKRRRQCTFAELMARFGVSSATIHRDAAELVRRDAVAYVRGGLVFNDGPSVRRSSSSDYTERVVANRARKAALAQKALATVQEGDILFLDSSTTVSEFARALRGREFAHLTIVTNSVSVMNDFRNFPPHWVLIGLGGNYDNQLNSIIGAAALEQLAHINLTKAYVSAFGFDEKTVTTNHERQAELIRKVLDAAERRYLLADRSKEGRTGLYRLAARGTFDAIFTA